jgi:signal transduction histidine kinase
MLIQHTAAGLLVVNSKDQIELINDQACRFAGIPPESTNLNLLRVRNPDFYAAVCETRPGPGFTYRQTIAGQVQVLSFKITQFKRNSETLRLVSIQDIHRELELKEGESYRKLISVLTHEIMNLMSPLTSVAGVLEKIYLGAKIPDISDIDKELIRVTRNSVAVIRDQSVGISNFLANYRKISKLPEPELSPFDALEWMEQLKIAFSGKMVEHAIHFDLVHDKALVRIEADKKLINQLIINILNNAIDAVKMNDGDRLIRIRLDLCRVNGVRITVSNNGPEIPSEIKDKIFVPFYTTKKEGSGIGLSICREIVRAHRGTMTLVSDVEHMTSFIIEL